MRLSGFRGLGLRVLQSTEFVKDPYKEVKISNPSEIGFLRFQVGFRVWVW